MSLRDEMVEQGGWLFRRRSLLPLCLAAPLVAALPQFEYVGGSKDTHLLWACGCFAISLLGLAVRIHAVGHAPCHTSGRSTKKQRAAALNTTGLYSVLRHPIYLGNFLMWLGLSAYCGQWWLVALFAMSFWIYYERIMIAEEEFLRGQHGEAFVAWSARTPAFVPRWSQWRTSDTPFSLRKVLRREYCSLLAISVCFAALDGLCRYKVEGIVWPSTVWTAMAGASLAIFVALRTINRGTDLLVARPASQPRGA